MSYGVLKWVTEVKGSLSDAVAIRSAGPRILKRGGAQGARASSTSGQLQQQALQDLTFAVARMEQPKLGRQSTAVQRLSRLLGRFLRLGWLLSR